jgi:hypothetical protein
MVRRVASDVTRRDLFAPFINKFTVLLTRPDASDAEGAAQRAKTPYIILSLPLRSLPGGHGMDLFQVVVSNVSNYVDFRMTAAEEMLRAQSPASENLQ